MLVERTTSSKKTTVLIDTGPDMREQLLQAKVTNLDAVLYTHSHADHVHGIDDLRTLAYRKKEKIIDNNSEIEDIPCKSGNKVLAVLASFIAAFW